MSNLFLCYINIEVTTNHDIKKNIETIFRPLRGLGCFRIILSTQFLSLTGQRFIPD